MPVVKSLLKRYEKQKNRGTQGFGYVTIKDGMVSEPRRQQFEYFIKEDLKKDDTASCVMFHHRFPTSTENFAEVTHPIVVDNKMLKNKYFVIHNGVMRNEDELKKKWVELGFVYTTDIKTVTARTIGGKTTKEETTEAFNDSESFAIDLALVLDGKKKEIESVGSIAFICLETTKKGKVVALHYGHNGGNPLVKEDNNAIFFLKSTGSGEDVPEDKIYSYFYATKQTIVKDIKIGSEAEVGFSSSISNRAPLTLHNKIHGQSDLLPRYLPAGRDDVTYDDTQTEIEARINTMLDQETLLGSSYDEHMNYLGQKTQQKLDLAYLSELEDDLINYEAELDQCIAERETLRHGGDKSFYDDWVKEIRDKIKTTQEEIQQVQMVLSFD